MGLDMPEMSAWEDFHDYPLWEQVISWTQAGASIVYEVEHEGRKRRLSLAQGKLIAASSEEPSENLAQVFLDEQLFSLEHYFQVSGSFDEEKTLAENLLASGLITPSEAERGDHERLFRILKGSLFLKSGRIRFSADQDSLPQPNRPVALVTALFRAFLEFEDRDWVLNQYDQHLHIGLIQQNVFPEDLWQIEALRKFQSIETHCEEGILFRDLAHRTGLPDFLLLKFLWISTQLGFLSRSLLLEADDQVVQHASDEVILPEEQPVPVASEVLSPANNRWKLWLMLALLTAVAGLAIYFWYLSSRPQTVVQATQPTEESVLATEELLAQNADEGLLEVPEPEVDTRNMGQRSMDQENLEAASAFWQTEARQWESKYTLGIYMVCDPENVLVLWRKLPEPNSLFVLPKTYRDQACYWVCWGRFDNRLDALAARSELPEVLGEVAPDAEAYLLSKLL